MTWFQIILGLIAVIFFLFARDGIQRKRLNLMHFLIFGGGSLLIAIFGLNTYLLNDLGSIFGVARGADLIVYISIIVLLYLFLGQIHAITKQEESITKLVSQIAINSTVLQSSPSNQSKHHKESCIIGLRCYNEATMIGKVIDDIILYGFGKIIIVDDGSRDHSQDVIAQKILQYQDSATIVYIKHPINRGPGAANKTLFEAVKHFAHILHAKRLITVDADDQMNIGDTHKFLDIINQVELSTSNIQIMLGSRFVTGGQTSNLPFLRKFILMGSKLVTYLFNGIWLSDPHNGFRCYQIAILDNITITSDWFSYANEINDCIYKYKLKYIEIPVYIKYTDYSLSKGQQSSSAIKIVKELIYKKFFFR